MQHTLQADGNLYLAINIRELGCRERDKITDYLGKR